MSIGSDQRRSVCCCTVSLGRQISLTRCLLSPAQGQARGWGWIQGLGLAERSGLPGWHQQCRCQLQLAAEPPAGCRRRTPASPRRAGRRGRRTRRSGPRAGGLSTEARPGSKGSVSAGVCSCASSAARDQGFWRAGSCLCMWPCMFVIHDRVPCAACTRGSEHLLSGNVGTNTEVR